MNKTNYNFNNFHILLGNEIKPAAYFFIGDDLGQIDHLCEKIIKKYFKRDDKNMSVFYFDDIVKNPDIIKIDTMSFDLFHNKKVVVIKRLKASIDASFLEILNNIAQQNLLLLQGENLKKSCLTARELSKFAKIINCYKFEVQQLTEYIAKYFLHYHIKHDKHIPALIAEKLQENLLIVDSELKKIQTYIGDDLLTENMLHNICSYLQVPSVVEICETILNKKKAKLNKIYEIIINEQVSKVAIIRQMQSFLNKILTLQRLCYDKSSNISSVINEYKPPIFFKEKIPIKEICSQHDSKKILSLLKQLIYLEIEIKKFTLSEDVLFKQFIINKLY